MMYSEESRYIFDGKATGFLKNYKGAKYSFAALLPNKGVDLYDYIGSLSPETLKNTLSNPKYVEVAATTPKFSYEYELTMNGVLGELGMTDAFSFDKADFTRLGRSSWGNIYVGDVLHKTFISVDEKGTKAGAVTKVEMKDTCAIIDRKVVTLDRPFLYMIIDNATNLPIFMGTVTEITQ
jgi:serpin B